MATARSTAPIVGGLSWLSVASVLTGTSVAHQPAYEVLKADLDRYPHLVDLFGKMGYRTGVLQPPVRARPGLRVANPYRFDRTFFLEDLDYRGPSYGWGIVPDQYSLAVAHEAFVEDQPEPFFLFAETVTSHAQWRAPPPPMSETAEALNRPTSDVPAVGAHDGALGRATRPADPDTLSQAERYFRYVEYEWRVLVEYLRSKAPPNSLVLVLGDHQPYFADGNSSATPIHVLSRRRTLVQQFEQHGMRSGLQLAPASDTLHHAGLYSLLVRVLTANDRGPKAGTDRLPPYRPLGVQRSALLDAPS